MDPLSPPAFFRAQQTTLRPLPVMTVRVHAGFPSPAEDHSEGNLDLGRRFVRCPSASYFCRVSGDSMTGEGIRHGDFVLVDRSRDPRDGDIVVAEVDGDAVVRVFRHDRRVIRLEAAHPAHPPIPFGPGSAVVGVVTSVHRDLLMRE